MIAPRRRPRPAHPGKLLARELAARGMSANALALRIRVPGNRIAAIVRCERAISAETAIRLGRYFGTGPELWIDMQTSYDVAQLEEKIGETVRREIEPAV